MVGYKKDLVTLISPMDIRDFFPSVPLVLSICNSTLEHLICGKLDNSKSNIIANNVNLPPHRAYNLF